MNPLDQRRIVREQFLALVERLVAEYAAVLPAGSVIRCAERSREELMTAGVRAGLLEATESMTRRRLDARIPAHA